MIDPTAKISIDISEFDGRALTDPERFRVELAMCTARKVADLRHELDAGRNGGPEIYRQMTLTLRVLAAELGAERNHADLERFRSETQLSLVRPGDWVVFMGVDPSVHGSGLGPVIEMFREEKLVLGDRYVVAQRPDVERGKTFAVAAPTGVLHVCYTYFGIRRPKEEAFVTDWAMG